MGFGDVLRITGLPIDGSPVTGNEKITNAYKSGKEKARELCFHYLGKPMESMNNEIRLSWLNNNFGNLSENYDMNVIAGKYGGAQNQEEEIAAPQDANTPMQQQDDQLEQGVEDANNPIQHHDA
ncbi:hypothetical protein V6N12_010612 [Hibiscus sabdariffa]|uniref:Uncharacterized protein n=1 Tax=Hibiscus sabdariffa TaxID=183260 RepID=A0ABR2EKZ4_9ROSI